MVRTTSSKVEKQTAPATTPAPVAAPSIEAPAKKAVKKTVVPKIDLSKVENVISDAPPATPQIAIADVADIQLEGDSSIATKLTIFGAKLQQLGGLFSSVKSDFRLLEKIVSRELKNAQKSSNRKKKSTGNRQPSGFIKPTRISDELAAFLGKNTGTEMARTEVSKEINAYIRSNGLQDKANGRKINADPKLSTLLKLKSEDELTYFNLQRYMKHHFIKAQAASAVTV